MASGAYLCQPGEAERRWMGDTSTSFLATGESTAGAFALVDETARQGESVPLHFHADDVESFYVLDGEIAFFLGDGPPTVTTAGGFVHIPAGATRGYRVESETARYLILTTPRHGEFYRAITLPAGPGGEAPQATMERETLAAAVREYGIEFVGPLPPAGQ